LAVCAAPEYLFDNTCDPRSDVFSLGCLLYALFNLGKSPLDCDGDVKVYKAKLEKLPTLDVEMLPPTSRGQFLIPFLHSIFIEKNFFSFFFFGFC